MQHNRSDTFLTSSQENNKSLVLATGLALTLGILLGGLIFCKGKHFKSAWQKISGKKVSQTTSENVKHGTKPIQQTKEKFSQVIDDGVDFKSIEDAKIYFENIGIKSVFKSKSENHLSDLNNIKKDLLLLEKNGVPLSKPHSIIVCDWKNADEIKQICESLNISKEMAEFCCTNTWPWGTISKSTDNKLHVLINSGYQGDAGAFIHEMGHIHQDFLKSSYWHSKGLNREQFIQKQMEVLGFADIELSPHYINLNKDTSPLFKSLFLSERKSPQIKEKVYKMFPGVEEGDLIKIFGITDASEKTYYINAKKMVDKMASESEVYAPTKAWENVAEIFQGLNKGKEYSDLVMLMYDINGGGRVPNLVIKGKKYDDYIASLYENKELIKEFRKCFEIKEVV